MVVEQGGGRRDEPATSAYVEVKSVAEGEMASRWAAYHLQGSADEAQEQDYDSWQRQVCGVEHEEEEAWQEDAWQEGT